MPDPPFDATATSIECGSRSQCPFTEQVRDDLHLFGVAVYKAQGFWIEGGGDRRFENRFDGIVDGYRTGLEGIPGVLRQLL